MKKSIITLAIVLLAVAAQAQTAIKVHNTGQISFHSSTTTNGIQISPQSTLSIDANITTAYSPVSLTKLHHSLAMSWPVKLDQAGSTIPSAYSFYVLGNGNVYAYGNYLTYSPFGGTTRERYPIENASEMQ